MAEAQNQTATPPANTQENAANAKPSFWQRPPAIVVGTAVLFVASYYGVGYLAKTLTHETTDDAFLAADVAAIAPKVSAQVTRVHVADNQAVRSGDLLLELDPRDFQVALDQRRAAVSAAKANIELLKAQVDLSQSRIATAEATAKQTAAAAVAAEASADRADADFKRAQELVQNHTISPQEFDSAKATANWAQADLKAAREKATSDQAKVGEAQAELEASHKAVGRGDAQARQADTDSSAAELNLSYTRITAPTNGYVTKKAVAEGDYVTVGQRLMALVPEAGLYVIANFKETQLQTLRPGQPAEIEVDSADHPPFRGHVESIMAGSGAAFSLLPPENAVGNYVKVVQRVPVKIVFDHPVEAGHVLGPGMSVVPSVRVRDYEIARPVVGVAAAIFALAIGTLWWVASRKRKVKRET